MKILRANIFCSFILLIACNRSGLAQIPAGYQSGLESITSKEMIDHIGYLAADSLKGRAAGSQENLAAATYIAERFRSCGLTPLIAGRQFTLPAPAESTLTTLLAEKKDVNDNEKNQTTSLEQYFQKFSIRRSRLTDNQSLSFTRRFGGGQTEMQYDYRKDFFVQHGGVPRSLSVTAPVVFVGYGIDEGEDGYNDYAFRDNVEFPVRNKIVVMVDGFPQDDNPASTFSMARKALYRNPLRKAEAAAKKGALAVLLIGSPLKQEPPFNIKYQQLARAFERNVDYLPERVSQTIPIFYISASAAGDLFAASRERLDSILMQINQTLKPHQTNFRDMTVSFQVNVRSELLNTQNVVGVLAGTDSVLKNEYVVVGAHYDHVGLGYYGAMNRADTGKIHNGADDNASGTAALMEIAQAFSKTPPRRSMLFVGFSGEENGLLGSRYYVNVQPMKPLDQTVVMLNCDMIGRNERELVWIGGGFYSDDLRVVADAANKEGKLGFELLYNTGMLTSASDQAPFLRKDIPALFFFSGLHDDYHTPADDVNKIDSDKASRIAKLAYLTGWGVSNSDKRPQYRELSVAERAVLMKDSKERQDKIRPPQEKVKKSK